MSRLVPALLVLILLTLSCKADRKPVTVLTAASLARAFGELEEVLERDSSKLDVQLEIGGSQQLCRKLVELGGRADVLAVADYRVIDRICREGGHAAFNIRFATNSITLAHMEHSRHTGEITADNWHELLLRPKVRLGWVDPGTAPIGYRTLLVWQLAGLELKQPDLAARLQAKVGKEHVAPHEGELLRQLQSRSIDYAFVYRSTAEEHNLKVVPLPDAYNLGSEARAAHYAKASVAARMKRSKSVKKIVGAAVTYGVTIPRDPPNPQGAEAFVTALLGEKGRRILEQTGFAPLRPGRCAEPSKVPPKLRQLVR